MTVSEPGGPIPDEIQSNILKNWGRNYGEYLFLRMGDQSAAARTAFGAWLRKYVTPAVAGSTIPFAGMAGIAWSGCRRLGIESAVPDDPEFQAGLGNNYWHIDRQLLDIEYSETDNDAFLLLAGNDREGLTETVEAAVTEAAQFSALLRREPVYRILDSQGRESEHFGFRDGISQPPDARSILMPEPSAGPVSWGCFAVWLKLEQHVERFRRNAAAIARAAEAKGIAVSPERIEELAVGRRQDGSPLVAASGDENEFTFEGAAADVCPFQAHIRIMNPRDGTPRRLIVRRGMNYGPGPLEPASADGRGLMFLGLVRTLLDFLYLIVRANRMRDPILSRTSQWGEVFDPSSGCHGAAHGQIWSFGDRRICMPFADVTTLRGAQYFYIPSMRFIRRLAAK